MSHGVNVMGWMPTRYPRHDCPLLAFSRYATIPARQMPCHWAALPWGLLCREDSAGPGDPLTGCPLRFRAAERAPFHVEHG